MLYWFGQSNDIFQYRSIPIYRFGFTAIIYIYKIKIKVYHKTLPQFKTNYSWFQSLASTKRKKKHTHTHTQHKKQKV